MTLLVAVTSACAQTRTITVTATVKNSSGDPVAQVPVGVIGGSVAVVRTNASGQAVISTQLPTTATKLLVLLSPRLKGEWYSDQDADAARYKAATVAGAFKPFYKLALDPQQSNYTIELAAQEVVKVTGRIVAPAATLKLLSVGSKWSVIDAEPSQSTGVFEIFVMKGIGSDVFIESSIGGEVHAVSMSSAQATADVSLGDIPVSGVLSGRKVEVRVSNYGALTLTAEVQKDGAAGACFFSADGSRIYVLGITRKGRVCLNDDDVSPLQLPPGTYYAATGGMTEFSYGMDLWRLLKAGREVDVLAAGVPKLVIPNDSATTTIEWTFDATQAATAIRSIN